MTTRHLTLKLTGLAMAATLAACGGGGDGGSDGPVTITVPTGARTVAASSGSSLTSTNFVGRSDALVRAVASAAGSGALAVASSTTEQAAARRSTMADALSPTLFTRLAAVTLGAANPRVQPQALSTETLTCLNGGTVTAYVEDNDNNNQLSAGDVAGFTAANCVIEIGLPAVSGSFAMTMEAVTLSGNQPSGFQVTVRTEGFSVSGYGAMSGTARLWATGLDTAFPVMRLSHQSTVVTLNGVSVPYLLDIYLYSVNGVDTYELSGGLTIDGQTYAVERLAAFVNSPPTLGSVKLLDAQGNAVTLRAVTALTFDLEYALPGTGAVAAQRGLAWSSYASNPL